MQKVIKKKIFLSLSAALMATMLFGTVTSAAPNNCSTQTPALQKTFTANVMAPLNIMNYNNPNIMEPADWVSFKSELNIAKSIGVDAVSVDVWWGDVEGKGDNVFDWSYYKTEFQDIKDAGLQIVPIMSFHQCGGNVGDTYTSLLPSWIWDRIRGKYSVNDMKYESELGNYSNEYVSLWADDLVMSQYKEFMDSFEQFTIKNKFVGSIQEVNISGGPSGELRYPSYNQHDWVYNSDGSLWQKTDANGTAVLTGDRTNWPYRGAVQWYGTLSLKDFKGKMKDKYKSVKALKNAWGKYAENVSSFDDIDFPNRGTDHGYIDGKIFKADDLFLSGDYYKSQYGRDLIAWYNQSLVDHGKRMIDAAKKAFDSQSYRNIPFGMKVPGIHWQMGTLGGTQPVAPRAAEIAAGLLNPSYNFKDTYDLDSEVNSNGHGYSNIISTFTNNGKQVNLHFTCLEMGNNATGGAGDTPNQYSLAKTLVGWFAAEAYRQNVTLKGENALNGGLPWVNEDFPGDWVDAWDHIDQALDRYPYSGITILRMPDVTTVTNPQSGKTVGKDHYQALINKFKNPEAQNQSVTVYYKSSSPKAIYTLTAADGGNLTSSLMKYDGKYNGGYWFKAVVSLPNYSKLYVQTLGGIPDFTQRVYMRYPDDDNNVTPLNTIYLKANDPLVYSSR